MSHQDFKVTMFYRYTKRLKLKVIKKPNILGSVSLVSRLELSFPLSHANLTNITTEDI